MVQQSILNYDEMESSVGTLTLVRTKDGLCAVSYGRMEDIRPALTNWAKRYFLRADFERNPGLLEKEKAALADYFKGSIRWFDIDLDLYGSPFQQKVWKALLEVPYGETKSYKEIAEAIHSPKAVRAVGGAVNRNPLAIIIPCHRIIGSNGTLVGYNGGLEIKKKLLEHEDADVIRRIG